MRKHLSAGGILLNSTKQVYLLHKISRDEWGLPKGTIEENENTLDAATREIKEETGYKNIKPLQEKPFETISWQMTHPKTGEEIDKTVYYFIFELLDSEFEQTAEMEAEELEGDWFDIDTAVEKVTFDDLREVVKKARSTEYFN